MRRVIIWVLAVLIIASGIVFTFYYQHQQSTLPIAEIKKAREVLLIAQKKGAIDFPNDYFTKANNYYDSAMSAWKLENKKFVLLRNYSSSKEFAKNSIDNAFRSIELTQNSTLLTRQNLALQIMNIKDQLKRYDTLFGSIPLSEYQRNQFNNGTLNLKEGIIAFKKEKFDIATLKLNMADDLINPIIFYAQSEFDNYFESDSIWKIWVDQSIAISKKTKTSLIVVDKYARECFLFQNGQKKMTFKIELGKNWLGDKNYQGDYSTPEGFYSIVDKKKQPNTKYYKALLLDYPNDDDKKRFIANKAKGKISAGKGIGNAIEIHGEGGRGADWTQGCIALENSELDLLYAACQVGTKVTIVGSVKSKDELLKID